MLYIGVDPGGSGGIAVISGQCPRITLAKFDGRTEHDINALFETIQLEAKGFCVAMIEQVHSMPKQGVSSSFTFGKSYGFLRGILVAHKIPFANVTPQKWQKALSCRTGGDKNVSKAKAQQLYPVLANYITHATADALLLATYAEKYGLDGGTR